MSNEMDGVDMVAHISRVKKCEHEYIEKIAERLSASCRKERVLTKTCTKCGNWKREVIWQEPL
jgi:deoxyribose-phosphate aldolase